ncbi:MAG: molybdopterin cofactor-binding domain-containing protein, partial [Roseiarcus sp.]
PLIDGADKVSGALRFAADCTIAGALHAKLVLSPRPHARVLRVDATAALAAPGVLAVFSRANTPHNRYNSSVWAAGQQALEDEEMFPAVVRHVGDRVAAVVADSLAEAEAAARLIAVEYEDLPAILDPLVALADAGPTLGPDGAPTFKNPIAELSFAIGDVARAFAEADLVVESRVSTPKTHHCALETHVCAAVPQADGRIAIHTPCQSVFAVQIVAAKALGVPIDRLRVIKAPIGGSFGGKAEPILEPLAVFFAFALRRPVTIQYGRQETCVATRTRSSVIGTMRTAFRRDGRILGRETEILADVGAYCTGGDHLPTSMCQRLTRLYDVANEKYLGRAVTTNTPPAGAFRGYGSPQIHTIAEINLDLAARKLALDPVMLRLKNLVWPGAVEPFKGHEIGNARIRDCLAVGTRRFHWRRRRKDARRLGRKASGVGVACATHINGCYPDPDEATAATLALKPDGRIALTCAVHDLGCGAETTLLQIAAEVLTVPPSHFDLCLADTDVCAYDLGTRASRMTYIAGEAVRRSAELMKARILAEAARVMNCGAGDLILEDGALRRGYGPGETLALARLAALLDAQGAALPIAAETYRAVANPGSYAAHFAAVEVDVFTGRVRVSGYLAVHDVGRAINPMLVEGQIHGGVQMGIGYALYEDVEIDPRNGVMRGDRFSRYPVVNAPEMTDVDTLLIEKGEPTGPFGAKAIGEIATIPVAAAIVNAVNHALGSNLCELPLTPERIAAWLEENEPA